jgi:hypothetical protein
MNCESIIEAYVSSLGGKFQCRHIGSKLQILTPYVYPDNDFISVFIIDKGGGNIAVTDLGETLRSLDSQGLDTSTAKKRYVIEQIAHKANVTVSEGRLISEGRESTVGDLILDVVTASKGIADLIYSARSYEPATFKDEVIAWVTAEHIQADFSVKERGVTGSTYTVDVRANTRNVQLLAQALSPPESKNVKPKINSVFRMWSDLNSNRPRVSILNDDGYEWKGEDVRLLSGVSIIAYWHDRTTLADIFSNPGSYWKQRQPSFALGG